MFPRKLEVESTTVCIIQLIIQLWCKLYISKESFPKLEGLNSLFHNIYPLANHCFKDVLFHFFKRDVGNTILIIWSKSESATGRHGKCHNHRDQRSCKKFRTRVNILLLTYAILRSMWWPLIFFYFTSGLYYPRKRYLAWICQE